MTEKEELMYKFYNIVEKIDEQAFINGDVYRYMKEICKLFKEYGICEKKEDE